MKKFLFGLLIISCSFVSVSFADFFSELRTCSEDSCRQQVYVKYAITKKKACSMKDGTYSTPLKIKRPRKAETYEYTKLSNILYYDIVVYNEEGSDFTFFSYNCSNKKITNITELYNLDKDYTRKILHENNYYMIYTEKYLGQFGEPEDTLLLEKETKKNIGLSEAFGLYYVFWESSELNKDEEYIKLNNSIKKYIAYAHKEIKNYYKSHNIEEKKFSCGESANSYVCGCHFYIENFVNDKEGLYATLYFKYRGEKEISKAKINFLTKTITVE